MSHSPHYVPSPTSPLYSPHPTRSPHLGPLHDDFLVPPQDQYEDALGLNLGFAAYPTYTADADSDLIDSASINQTYLASPWPASPHYPLHNLLESTQILENMSLSSSSPALPSHHPIHDSYWYPNSPYESTHRQQRNVPVISVSTELSSAQRAGAGPSASSSYHFQHSPSSHSPSITSYTRSPSSIGSAPPITPETYTISPHGSPFINQASASPISPSAISAPPTTFDPKDSLITAPQPELSVLEIAHSAGHPYGGVLVPQKTYRPHTVSDRRRYVDEVHLEEPIMFYTNNPAGCGILLKDAIASKFSNLVDRDDAMFVGRGPSVSIRLNWPGYTPWSRQIPTRDFRSPPHPITRAKLARNVAKTINRFIQEMENQAQEDTSESKWAVGQNRIRLEDLMLVGLQHVSMGSWQAHVRLIRRH